MAFDSRRQLAEIACPTLTIAGSNDQAVPMLHARIHAGDQRFSARRYRWRVSHVIWTHADELIRGTEEFLAA